MPEKIRWGILGTGSICHKFATGLGALDDAEIAAVGSRSTDRADAFADEFDIPHRHGSYDELAADGDVDVIYVGSPHTAHHDNTVQCLRAGKPVLCEKPFGINAAEVEEMIRIAREKKLFLMEAMWMRYFPAVVRLRQMIADGKIGEVRLVTADFGFRLGWNPESRLLDPTLGGGALLDLGIYPISLASMLLGEPDRITTDAHLGETGVDEQSAWVLHHEGGALAIGYSALRTNTPREATIMGTEGMVRIHNPWWQPSRMTFTPAGGEPQEIEEPFEGNGYPHEASEVARCLRAGELESPVMPLDESLQIMRTMDAIRGQWGLTYPGE